MRRTALIAATALLAVGCSRGGEETEPAPEPAGATAVTSVFPTPTTDSGSVFFGSSPDDAPNSFLPAPGAPATTESTDGSQPPDSPHPDDGAVPEIPEIPAELDGDGSMTDECDDPTGFASLFGACDDDDLLSELPNSSTDVLPDTSGGDDTDVGATTAAETAAELPGEKERIPEAFAELDLFSDRGAGEAVLRSLHFLVHEQDEDFGTRAAQASAYVLKQAHPDLSVEHRELEKWFWLMCDDYLAPQDGSEAPYSLYGDGAGVIDLILEHSGDSGRDEALISEGQEPFYVAMTLYAAYLVCPESTYDAYAYSPTLLRARLSAMSTPGYGIDYTPAAEVLERLEDPPLTSEDAAEQSEDVASSSINDLWQQFFAEDAEADY